MTNSVYATEEIKDLERQIEVNKDLIERIPKMRLGMILKNFGYVIKNHKYSSKPFEFTWHSHDTGIDVECYLTNNEGESLKIIRRTYWYNESTYGFNPYTELHGKWDDALNRVISDLRKQLTDAYNSEIESYKSKIARIQSEAKEQIDKFGEMFS